MSRRRELGLNDVMSIAGSLAALAMVWQLAHPAPPQPKTFSLHVGGSPNVPYVLEVWGGGVKEKRIIEGTIPFDHTFTAQTPDNILVQASRPKGVAHGVIELTLLRDGKIIDRGETRAPQNLAQVTGS